MTAKHGTGRLSDPRRAQAAGASFDDYFAIDAVHWSTLKAMADSPAHYRFAAKHKVEATPAMLIGQAVHEAILQPDDFPRHWTLWAGQRRGAAYAEFALVNRDKNILTEADYQKVLDMRDSVRRHPQARKLLVSGRAEVPLIWTDAKTGLRLKARLDWLRPRARMLCELKTTRSFDEHSWTNTIAREHYDGQIAMYLNGLLATRGEVFEHRIIGVENNPPYDAGVFALDDDWLYQGECLVRRLLDMVAMCRRARRWPGRYPGTCELALPGWVQVNEEMGAIG